MAYRLEEQLENGGTVILGEPINDVMVAKVVASQRAFRTQRLMVVREVITGHEVARFDASTPVPRGSVRRMRSVPPVETDDSMELTRVYQKKSG